MKISDVFMVLEKKTLQDGMIVELVQLEDEYVIREKADPEFGESGTFEKWYLKDVRNAYDIMRSLK